MAVENPPPIEVPPVEQLRDAAMRLTAELDQARLHQSAAYVSMAVDAMARRPDPAVNDNVFRSDVECQFEVDEYDRVWMYRLVAGERASAAPCGRGLVRRLADRGYGKAAGKGLRGRPVTRPGGSALDPGSSPG